MGWSTDSGMYDPLTWDIGVATDPLAPPDIGAGPLPSGIPSSAPPLGTTPTGPAAPVSGQPGSSLLGWLGLANNVAQTAIAASRRGQPTYTRPGTLTQSVASTGALTLGIIAVVFVLVVMALRKA